MQDFFLKIFSWLGEKLTYLSLLRIERDIDLQGKVKFRLSDRQGFLELLYKANSQSVQQFFKDDIIDNRSRLLGKLGSIRYTKLCLHLFNSSSREEFNEFLLEHAILKIIREAAIKEGTESEVMKLFQSNPFYEKVFSRHFSEEPYIPEEKNNYKQKNNYAEKEASYPKPQIDINEAYKTLGLTSTASVKEVNASYRQQVLLYHPDKTAGINRIDKKGMIHFNETTNMNPSGPINKKIVQKLQQENVIDNEGKIINLPLLKEIFTDKFQTFESAYKMAKDEAETKVQHAEASTVPPSKNQKQSSRHQNNR